MGKWSKGRENMMQDAWVYGKKGREERELTGSAKNVICLRAPMGIFTWWICDELPKRVPIRMPLPSGRKPLKAQWRVFCSVAGSRTVRGMRGGGQHDAREGE